MPASRACNHLSAGGNEGGRKAWLTPPNMRAEVYGSRKQRFAANVAMYYEHEMANFKHLSGSHMGRLQKQGALQPKRKDTRCLSMLRVSVGRRPSVQGSDFLLVPFARLAQHAQHVWSPLRIQIGIKFSCCSCFNALRCHTVFR